MSTATNSCNLQESNVLLEYEFACASGSGTRWKIAKKFFEKILGFCAVKASILLLNEFLYTVLNGCDLVAPVNLVHAVSQYKLHQFQRDLLRNRCRAQQSI